MKGTEKQIKWADDIKEAAYTAIGNLRNKYIDFRGRACFESDGGENFATSTLQYNLRAVDMVEQELDKVFAAITDAAAIIDKRTMFAKGNLEKLARTYYRAEKGV